MFRPLLVALLLTACASNPHGTGSQSAKAAKEVIKRGVIESVTPIQLDNSSDGGIAAGSIFGQVGGANSGGGRGAVVGSILGNVLGSTLGQQAGIATRPGLEIWVRLNEEDKSTYVMQPGQPDSFRVGDQVRVIRKDGVVRVEPVEMAGPTENKLPP